MPFVRLTRIASLVCQNDNRARICFGHMSLVLGRSGDNIVQSLDGLINDIPCCMSDPLGQPFCRQGPNLPDLDPCLLACQFLIQLQNQRIRDSLGLTGNCHGDDRFRLIEDLITDDQNGAFAGLFMPAQSGIQSHLEADWIPAFAGMTERAERSRIRCQKNPVNPRRN